MSVVCSSAEAEAAALRSELDALRRDAERKEKKAAAQTSALTARTDELERQLCVPLTARAHRTYAMRPASARVRYASMSIRGG